MTAEKSSERTRLHAFVHGRVQGVWFRDFTRRHAAALGMSGWVRNLPDGRVELEAEGPRPALDELLRHVHAGQPRARVEAVAVEWLPPTGDHGGFIVR